MNCIKSILWFYLPVLLLFSCNTQEKYNYAIKDFNSSLRPYLINIVSRGIVYYDSSVGFIQNHATDQELNHLALSENPILRSTALQAMLTRKTFNHFEVLMAHLDDTAMVIVNEGEFGPYNRTVSDDLIEESVWKTNDEKNKTINKVLTEHNYLRSAYTILLQIEATDKYYIYVKDMAKREKPFNEVECALYGLAKFKRAEDISFIKNLLLNNHASIGQTSFRLMKEFPDSAYLEVLKVYSKRGLYRHICLDKNTDDAESFFSVLASYKEQRSAAILLPILNRTPFLPCIADTAPLKESLRYAIWNNKCDAYNSILKEIRTLMIKYEKKEFFVDTSLLVFPKLIRWSY